MIRNTHCLVTVAVLASFLAAGIAWSADHPYVGTKNCKKCHIKEWKSWKDTAMAHAFETLRPGERPEAKTKAGLDPDKDYTKDSTCLPCHTTGYGEAGGFVDEASTPELLGVSCEMCHGAGGTYVKDEYMSLKNKEYKLDEIVAAGMVRRVSVDQCKNCHNSDSPFVGEDFKFDFDANKDKGTHANYPLKYSH